ncbi:hypothetical protein, partial [Vibrio anguillarum]|uniref:hypothetical protein n=1 Tax=Vibrio anguillarum TaxID=55601 RepID=UPI00188D10D3
DNSFNSVNNNNLKLIEEKTELESEKSELSVAVATVEGELADLKSKYQRLSKLFTKSRQAKKNALQRSNSDGWYVNQRVVDELPQLIVLGGSISDS